MRDYLFHDHKYCVTYKVRAASAQEAWDVMARHLHMAVARTKEIYALLYPSTIINRIPAIL